MKIRVITHSGLDEIMEVAAYEPKILTESLNNKEISSVQIGQNIYARIDVKFVGPVVTQEA